MEQGDNGSNTWAEVHHDVSGIVPRARRSDVKRKLTVSIDRTDGRMDESRNVKGKKALIGDNDNEDNDDNNDKQPSNAKPFLARPYLLVSFE